MDAGCGEAAESETRIIYTLKPVSVRQRHQPDRLSGADQIVL